MSVVVPVRDGRAFLGEALDSARQQTWEPLEVVVVDDGSSDGSGELAASYPGVRVLRRDPRGPAAARNVGVSASRGELIAFLDADDKWPPTKLDLQAGYLRDHPEVECVLGRQELILTPGHTPPAWAANTGGDLERAARSQIPTMSMVFRRSTWERVGSLNPAFGLAEDTDWLLRAHDLGVTIHVLDEVVLLRRLHGNNLTYDQQGLRRGLALALKGRIDRHRAAPG